MTHFIRSSILFLYYHEASLYLLRNPKLNDHSHQLHKIRMTHSQFLYKLSVQIELIQFLKTNTYLPVMGAWTITLIVFLPIVTLIQGFLHKTILSFDKFTRIQAINLIQTNAFVSLVKSWRLDKFDDDITIDF